MDEQKKKEVATIYKEVRNWDGSEIKRFREMTRKIMNLPWEEIEEWAKNYKDSAESDYLITFDSVRHWLINKGYILPKNFDAFIKWYMTNKDIGLWEDFSEIEEGDFVLFHEERERLALGESYTIDIPYEEDQPQLKLSNDDIDGNNFNCMPLNQVIEYFTQCFFYTKSANGKPFLTEGEVMQFVERAIMGNKSVQKLTLNYDPKKENNSIVAIFHTFYKISCEKFFEPSRHSSKKYKALATDNFTNPPASIQTNFRS